MKSGHRLRVLPPILILALACGVVDESTSMTAVHDSAGVTIVYSEVPVWTPALEWKVPDKPILTFGVAIGKPELEFETILGLTRLSNGNIIVGNKGGTPELRFFRPTGEFVRTVGRDGEGPGEFRALNGIYPYRGDSLVVWDYRIMRWSVYDTAGTFARTVRPDVPGWNLRSLSPLRDGTLMIADTYRDSGARRSVEYVRIFRVTSAGALIDSLGTHRSRERFRLSSGERVVMSRIFGARLVRAGAPDGYFVGSGEEYEILDFGVDGRLRRRLRWAGPDRTVTSADVESYRRRFLSRERYQAEAFARLVMEVPAADRFPAYTQMIRDRAGYIWLAAYPRPGRSGPRAWTILDANGQWLGDVALPERLQVWDIGNDYILGVVQDTLGVERVHMYRLQRSSFHGGATY